ncbi:MAG: putative nucleotidyltransferase substrate binding domain-containing protein, partial [Candidatus Doudnabacteria bacterium]
FGPAPLSMLMSSMDIKVELDGDEIVVTKPGTDFLLAYRKRSDSPNLVLTRSWEKPTRDRSVAPDNLIDPKRLTPLTRTSLKEAFRAVAKVQRGIGAKQGFTWR